MKNTYPCDGPDSYCPYDAEGGYDCRNYCGLGVDEDEPEDYVEEREPIMLIKMRDGGIIDYTDDTESYPGCETCDYGSEYINNIDITLTKYAIHVRTNQMYEYVLSEGMMMKLFLTEYNLIQCMTEKEFIDWFKAKMTEITHSEFEESVCGRRVEFHVKEI